MPARSSLSIEERIRARFTEGPADECWLWQGSVNGYTGYGQFSYRDHDNDGKCVGMRAHKAVYEMYVGPVPSGLTLDHLCMVKTCVNPSHLEPVTQAENNRRAIAALGTEHLGAHQRAKTHCPQGHPYDAENVYVYRGSRRCRSCTRARVAQWQRENREHVNAYRRARYARITNGEAA